MKRCRLGIRTRLSGLLVLIMTILIHLEVVVELLMKRMVEGISISLILSNVTNFLLANLLIILLDFSFDLYLSHDFSLGSFGLSGSTRLGDLGWSCVGTGAGGGILLGTAFGWCGSWRVGSIFLVADGLLDLTEADFGAVGIGVTSTSGNQVPVDLQTLLEDEVVNTI